MNYEDFMLTFTDCETIKDVKANTNWYGIEPYNDEQLEESKKSWNHIKETRKEFIFNLVQDALYVGMIYHNSEAPMIRKYLSDANDNLLYATADFINELLDK